MTPPCALRAALEILDRAPLPTRAGISTGEVIAAVGEDAGARTVAGDVVLSAGSLREAAEIGSVLVADRTRRAAGATFTYSDDGLLPAGSDRPNGRRLLGEDRVTLAPSRDELPFVGREAELHGILGLFDETVETRRPRLLVLIGAAGVGKSRLVAEVAAALPDRHPGARVMRGRCLSGGRGSVYWALGEILRDACEVSARRQRRASPHEASSPARRASRRR